MISYKESICLETIAVGFQNILRMNPLPVVSLVLPRETCLVIEGGAKPACNQWRFLLPIQGVYTIYTTLTPQIKGNHRVIYHIVSVGQVIL